MEKEMRATLVPLLERYNVDVFLSGHKHNYERLLVNGITYLVSGGGGGRLTALGAPDPNSQRALLAHHFLLIEVDGDRLTGAAIDYGGNVIDSWELTSGDGS